LYMLLYSSAQLETNHAIGILITLTTTSDLYMLMGFFCIYFG
jgi:hypothetical protein